MGKIQSILKGLKLAHLAPETPAIANMLTGEVMGHSADRLASRFGVSRADQDAFGARSHQNAAKVHVALTLALNLILTLILTLTITRPSPEPLTLTRTTNPHPNH